MSLYDRPTFSRRPAKQKRQDRHKRAVPKRNNLGDTMPRLTPPTPTTFLISVIVAVLAILGHQLPQLATHIPLNLFWLMVIAWLVLFFGNLIKGI
jgi:hypothetical protein